ncbi:MAG TPA: hypothetical protein VGG73_09225 [Vicinamibacterales bacterium]
MKTPGLFVLAVLAGAGPAAAQEQVVTPPPSLVLNNYASVPVGPFGGLEGSSVAARVSDPSAAWFNPAGLTREDGAQISGSAGVYQYTSVTLNALPNQSASFEQLPNFVGFTIKAKKLTLGAALLTTNSWVQETDSQIITPTGLAVERFAYSGDSSFVQREFALSAGYYGGGKLRVGGGLSFMLMDLRLVQSVSDRVAGPTGLNSLLVTSRLLGDTVDVRAQGGVQYDLAPHWRLGGTIRTPGLTMWKSATITQDGLLDSGPSSQGASVFDANAALAYDLPWEFQAGVAYVGDRAQFEVDVSGYTPIAAYAMASTANPIVVYGDSGNNGPPSVVAQPFPGFKTQSVGVTNVGAGGQLLLFKGRTLLLHGSVAENNSPVGDADQIFTRSDLLSWTLGVSGSIKKFLFSVGVNDTGGTANNQKLRNLLSGQTVTTDLNIRTIGLIYSIAYQF